MGGPQAHAILRCVKHGGSWARRGPFDRSRTDDHRKRRKMSKLFWASLEVDLRGRMRIKKVGSTRKVSAAARSYFIGNIKILDMRKRMRVIKNIFSVALASQSFLCGRKFQQATFVLCVAFAWVLFQKVPNYNEAARLRPIIA